MNKMLLPLIIILSIVSCKTEETREKYITEPLKVKTITVTPQMSCDAKSYIGAVEEDCMAHLSFATGGTISKVFVSEGMRVKKGTLLMQLSAPQLDAVLKGAISTYAQAEDGFKRAKILYDSNSLPEIKYVDAKTKLEQAESALGVAKQNVEDTYLYAPFSGVVGKDVATVGEVVLPSMPLMSLLSIDRVKVKVAIPENEISQLSQGDRAVATVGALNNDSFEGVVTSSGIVSDIITHTYDVELSINDSSKRLLPGMICNVEILSDSLSYFSLPNNAISIIGDDCYVWVVENGVSNRRKVERTGLSSDGVVIGSGIESGDEVVVEGMQKLSSGVNVIVE